MKKRKAFAPSSDFLRGFVASCWMLVLFAFAGSAFADGVKILRNVPSTFVYPADGFLPFDIHRGTQTMLSLMVPGCSFSDPRGVACALLAADHDPRHPQNDVVVTCVGVNSGAGELIYNVGLKDIRRFGSVGSGEGQFRRPTGVAVNPDGRVAVADTGNDRIVLLRHDGLRLSWVKAVGKKGSAPGRFEGPAGLAFDSRGNLYIADTGNNRIQVMDPKGRFRVLDTPPLEAPTALAAIDAREAWTFYQKGPYADRLAVIDRKGTRLQTLTLAGQPLAQITADQIPDGPVDLWGCAFDYYGNVVATDFARSALRKFDKNLRYVVTFGGPGDGDFEFDEPRGIAINHQFGQILVAEKDSVQYFWNGADALGLRAAAAGKGLKFPFFLTERALVSAEVLDGAGNPVTVLSKDKDLDLGERSLEWEPGPEVPSGGYTLRLRVMATYSSRERIAKEIDLPVTYTK